MGNSMSAPRLETQPGKTQAVMQQWVESGESVLVWVSLSSWSIDVKVCSFFVPDEFKDEVWNEREGENEVEEKRRMNKTERG